MQKLPALKNSTVLQDARDEREKARVRYAKLRTNSALQYWCVCANYVHNLERPWRYRIREMREVMYG